MDFNKIQELLEKLPDQQIMQYAQGSNPQVPQILAQMEAARRENMRKSEVMQGPGIMGMYKGGEVRKFNTGGLSESRKKFLDREEEILERAKKKRGGQMKPTSDSFRERAGQVVSDVAGMAKAGLGALIPDAIEENFARQQALRNPAAAEDAAKQRSYASLMAQAEQMPAPPATPAAPQPPAVAAPQPPAAPAAPAQQGSQAGIGALGTPQAKPMQGPAPAVGTGAPPPEAMQKLAEATDAQSTKFAEAYKSIFADRDAMRQAGQSAAPDADKDRRMAFFYGLAKFGATLATTGVLARAGDTGLEAFRSELEKSKEKQDQFRKESLEIGLAALDDKLKMLGIEQGLSDKEKAEARQALEDMRKDKELKLKEREVTAKEKVANAQATNYYANAEKDRAETGTGGEKRLTFKDALALVQKKRADMLASRPNTTFALSEDEEAKQLMRQDPARVGLSAATGAATGANIAPAGWKLVK